MFACHEEYRRARVAEIMSADLWQSGGALRDQAGEPRTVFELRQTLRLSMLSLPHGVDG